MKAFGEITTSDPRGFFIDIQSNTILKNVLQDIHSPFSRQFK